MYNRQLKLSKISFFRPTFYQNKLNVHKLECWLHLLRPAAKFIALSSEICFAVMIVSFIFHSICKRQILGVKSWSVAALKGEGGHDVQKIACQH